MLLWILIALMTAAAIMAVLMPLARAPAGGRADQARRVYLDQLKELEADRAAGRISDVEAGSARAEIARRLIATEAETGDMPGQGSQGARRFVAVAALAGIPILALGLYLGLGAPNLPGQPLAARMTAPAGADDVERLIAQVEEHLAREPEDGRGWEVIAPIYLRLGQAGDAANAYRNAIRILGSSAARQAGLGEAIVAAESGIVTEDARVAFEAAERLEPAAPGPRFYLALAREQEGDAAGAAEGWRALLADAPADAPWRGAVEVALARVAPGRAPAGPTTAEVSAAAEMTPEQQTAMIEGMVEGLAGRLEQEPADVEGWLRLMRSYVVLGRTNEAAEAAQAALAGVEGAADRERVEALMAELGLGAETAVGQ